jgi:hypothetical protein
MTGTLATSGPPNRPIPPSAALLGYFGVLPFAFGALVMVLGGLGPLDAATARTALVAYGAVILSFLGGIRWGAGLRIRDEDMRGRVLALSVIPSLIAWVALLVPALHALGLLVAAFVAQGAWDVRSTQDGHFPRWFGQLRVRLTLMVTLILIVAMFVLMFLR